MKNQDRLPYNNEPTVKQNQSPRTRIFTTRSDLTQPEKTAKSLYEHKGQVAEI